MSKIALVVDDTPFIREDIKDILEDQGYEVYEANDGMAKKAREIFNL